MLTKHASFVHTHTCTRAVRKASSHVIQKVEGFMAGSFLDSLVFYLTYLWHVLAFRFGFWGVEEGSNI